MSIESLVVLFSLPKTMVVIAALSVINLSITGVEVILDLATKKEIIAFGTQKGDAYKIIEETSNSYFEYDQVDINSLIEKILSIYEDWKSGKESENKGDFESYSRENLTRQLVSILEEITS